MLRLGILVCCITAAFGGDTWIQENQDVCLENANQNGSTKFCKMNEDFEGKNFRCVELGPAVRCPQGRFVSQGSVCVYEPDGVTFLCRSGSWVMAEHFKDLHRKKRFFGDVGKFFDRTVGAAARWVGGRISSAISCLLGSCSTSVTQYVYIKDEPPTIKGCPQEPIEVAAPRGKASAFVSNWPKLTVTDKEDKNPSLSLIFGNNPKSEFPEGKSFVVYKARDSAGGTDYCWISVDVKVIYCYPEQRYPRHGDFSCSHTKRNLYGSACTFTCDVGYKLDGNSSAVTCTENGTWDQPTPTCQPVSCGDPGNITSGILSCPDGHVYPKLCYVSCNPGYRQRQGFPFKRCTETRAWTPTQDCADVEAPKFPNGCPSNMRLFSGPLESPVTLNWTDPLVTDNSGLGVTLTSDVSRGSLLDVGIHIIKLTATDMAGNSRSCSFVVSISARECYPPITPSNGRMTCTRGYVEGSECSVTCDAGYELQGNATLTCLDTEQWSSNVPTCEAVQCGSLPKVDHGRYECGSLFYPAVCVLVCDDHYSREGDASIRCQATGQWSAGNGSCVDKEPPEFPNGCSRNVEIYQSRVGESTIAQWAPPDVTDNSGENVTLQCSHASGSAFSSGVTYVTYTATDSGGNERKCAFTVTVTTLTCPPLSQNYSTTNYLRYRCPQKNVYGAECTPYCTQGFPLRGADRVTCEIEDNVTFPPLMAWTWVANASRPECIATNCSRLTPPLNGALSCYQGNFAKECLMSCQEPWDVPSRTDGRYVCPNNVGTWTPPNVLNCTIRSRPGQVRMMSDLSYYTNSCNMSLEQLKQAFIQRIHNSTFGGACRSTPSCRAENIEVTCGELTGRRRRSAEEHRHRRQTGSHYVQVTFEIIVEYNETGKQPQQAYQDIADTKEAIYNALKSEAEQGHFNVGSLKADEYSVGYPFLRADCPPGTLFVEKTTKKKMSCVGCGAGHYLPVNGSQCQQCEVGTYSELDNATSCTPCPPGWSTPASASTSSSDCEETCTAGQYSEDGFVPCLPCPPGQYQSRDGATGCVPCPASTWTSGGASDLAQCVAADVFLGNDSGISAHLTGSVSALTLTSFVHLNDMAAADVTFTFQDSSRISLSVHVYTQTEGHATLPQNSSTSVSTHLKANSWSQLVLTADPTSGLTKISNNNNNETIMTYQRPTNSFLSSISVEIVASKGEVIVSGLFAAETFQMRDGVGDGLSSCNGNNAANLLTWRPAPSLVQSPSVCDAVDECQSSPCSSHSVCVNKQDGYLCQCLQGWTGVTCNVAPAACFQHQCQNGATCASESDSYTCVCTEEYSGDFCQLKKVHGGFSDWSSWGNCSANCGGRQQRQRHCNNPTPRNDGNNCTGLFTETQPCGQADCAVDGEWSEWSAWSACSATCGGGNRTRQRSCDNPPPQYGGDPCDDESEEKEACNTDECPVNGGWRDWSEWSPCSVTCGGGTRSRVRSCDSPAPANGGDPCSGATNETETCSEQKCPECSGLRRSVTTLIVCEEETSPFLRTCNLTCAPGYATSKLLPQYQCGESTGYLWNDQRDYDSPVVLPQCSVARTPTNFDITQNVPLKSGCDVDTEAVRSSITENMVELSCMSAGCKTEVSITCDGQSPGALTRRRRSEGNLRVVTRLSMDLGNSTDFTANNTGAIESFATRLTLAYESAVQLVQNETDRIYSVSVGGEVIEPDASSMTYNAGFQCQPGSTVVYFLCVPCVPGSMEVDGQCELCPVGQYQDEPGSTACKLCPAGLTYDLRGASDVSQCLYPVQVTTQDKVPDQEPDSNTIIVISTVVALAVVTSVVIGINAYIFCRRKPKRVGESDEMKPAARSTYDVQRAEKSRIEWSRSSAVSSYPHGILATRGIHHHEQEENKYI